MYSSCLSRTWGLCQLMRWSAIASRDRLRPQRCCHNAVPTRLWPASMDDDDLGIVPTRMELNLLTASTSRASWRALTHTSRHRRASTSVERRLAAGVAALVATLSGLAGPAVADSGTPMPT